MDIRELYRVGQPISEGIQMWLNYRSIFNRRDRELIDAPRDSENILVSPACLPSIFLTRKVENGFENSPQPMKYLYFELPGPSKQHQSQTQLELMS
jgi:hypothetical protein